jgi:chitinase
MTPEERARALPLDPYLPEREPRRLAWWRLTALLFVVAAVVGLTTAFVTHTPATGPQLDRQWFAPYVDVTATPAFAFEDPQSKQTLNVVLSFIVAAAQAPCTPTWGNYYTLDTATNGLDMERRIARLRQRGGDVAVSFGGLINKELSVGCTDPTALAAAYKSVIDRYALTRIDLDIEGAESLAPDVMARRAQALALVQQQVAQAGRRVGIWLTLPVAPFGLDAAANAAVASMLTAGVSLAGVNVMTMDYGQSKAADQSMGTAAVAALGNTMDQLVAAYAAAGQHLSEAQAWAKLGATPMIGQNDIVGERFDTDDARRIADFASRHAMGRLSMWSLNRDVDCGPNLIDVVAVSDNCSGVSQQTLEFSKILADGTTVRPPTATPSPTVSASGSSKATLANNGQYADDPATSPYPVWKAVGSYPKGTKVVWHHNVYIAKWYTVGDVPDTPVAAYNQTPWQLLGPVLPGDHPVMAGTLAPGTYPEWYVSVAYFAGQRIQYQGLGYEAKWWTQGDTPGLDVAKPGGTPWLVIGADGKVIDPGADPDLDAKPSASTSASKSPSSSATR